MEKKNAADAQSKRKQSQPLSRLFRSNKVLIPFSLFLAVWVWLILVVGSSESEDRVIERIPIKVDFSGTVSESLGLHAFWPQNVDPEHLTVDVTIRGKKYDISPAVVSAEDLKVELLPKDINNNDINAAGDYQLQVRVTQILGLGKANYKIISTSPATISVYFDHTKTTTFPLELAPIGEVTAASEEYFAATPLLSRKTVSITGPAKDVNSIRQVKAQFLVEGPLEETQTFNDVQINPIIDFGAVSQYLTIDAGGSPISVTVPVWKRAQRKVSADFIDQPRAYIAKPLPVTFTPANVRAALPEKSIREDGTYSVGQISFRQLSPGNNVFTFLTSELKEIYLFDALEAFRVEVDMTGMAETRLTLPKEKITVAGGNAAVGDVQSVAVVGPKDVVEALTPQSLSGEVILTEETPKGSATLPVSIAVEHEDCWVYAPKEYVVACVVN